MSGRLTDQATVLEAAFGTALDRGNRRRAEYSSDASNYRVVPQGVIFARDTDELIGIVETCRRESIPLTVRGGGTSIAGNAVGPGVIIDCSRHLTRIGPLDGERSSIRVQPGVVLDDLQSACRPHGLRFGPDPSTHSRCTVGGMIGNNACGAHAMGWGTTASNVLSMEVIDGRGRTYRAGPLDANNPVASSPVDGLASFVEGTVSPLAGYFGKFSRQVSGYGFERLVGPGANLAQALVGSEGTLAVILEADLNLVPIPRASALVVLGYRDMAEAADDLNSLLPFSPVALEGLDSRMTDVLVARRGPSAVPELPRGGAWLMCEVTADREDGAKARGSDLARASGALDSMVVNGTQAARLWRIREDGAGLAGRTVEGRQCWPAWEDSAVPPERFGDYLRDFERLLLAHDLAGVPYGHFGDGCLHVRIDLPLDQHPERLRPFLTEASELVGSYGGSLSGEHGDGRARSELLPLMYPPQVIEAFGTFKTLFDPDSILNPGVLVDPDPVDQHLRRPQAGTVRSRGMALLADQGDLTSALHRCVGVGKCRADNSTAGGFMCPSFLATGDEKDSTRARARVLQEAANGTLVSGFSAPEVEESLDLCLSCKACASDCPAGVDMARFKSEVLHQKYLGRLKRPVTHYSLGRLPQLLRLARRAPRLANLALAATDRLPFIKSWAGIDHRRRVPLLATRAVPTASNSAAETVLFVDTFTSSFNPRVAEAALEVLDRAGVSVRVISPEGCCGLTWISTGQLDGARRQLKRTLEILAPEALAGRRILVLEPSCAAALRDDLPELLAEDPRAKAVADAVRTFSEVLLSADTSWLEGFLTGSQVVAQPHCHQHAVFGFTADRAIMEMTGAEVKYLAGCCGLAGNFGMEKGHYELSRQIASRTLLPALASNPRARLVADGFSCRTQAGQLGGQQGNHLAELLAEALEGRH